MTQSAVTFDRLVDDLRALGLAAGDSVYVHTSMKRIGWIEGGAPALLEAFLTVLGPEGTLAVPNHTYSFVGFGNPPYDPAHTPTELGLFPETVRLHPRALRSAHASHATAAIGANAAYLTQDHDPTHALGERSPLYRLYRMPGRVLLLGVTHKANTMLHLAESLSGIGYTRLHYDASWGEEVRALLPDGTIATYRQREFPGCSSMFDRLDRFVPEANVRRGKVGFADAQLLDATAMVDTAIALLRAEPGFFLCQNPACPCCPARKAWLAQRRETNG